MKYYLAKLMIPVVAKVNRCLQGVVKPGRSAGNSTGWFLCLLLLAGWLSCPCPAHAQVPPTITLAPTNQVLSWGGTVSLAVTAAGDAPLAYQWFKDSRLLLNQTNNTLTVTNASVTASGTYYVLVTNLSGMVISLPMLVAVGNPALLAWGANANGELGNHSNNVATVPFVAVSNVVAGAAGYDFSLFVTSDGILWGMGSDQDGELGDGMILTPFVYDVLMPTNVASNVAEVAAGYWHSLFIKRDGTLWGAGYSSYGQLATNYLLAISTPRLMATKVVIAAAGFGHSLYTTMDGTLWGVGYNMDGELGNGTTNNTYTPIAVASNVVAVAAGIEHSLFVTSDGTLWAMGKNQYGQLGNGTTNNANVYVPVSVASDVVAVVAGGSDSLFVKADGTLWTMGVNNAGQLGDGTTNDSSTPILVPHLSVASIFAGCSAAQSLVAGTMQESATVTLGNINQLYTGSAVNVTASTTPPGLTVNLTYNGSPLAPTNAGSYTVIGTISDANYYGSATNTLVVGLPPQGFTASNTSGINGPQLTLQLSGTPGYPYVLQTATNLTPPVNWQSVFTNPADVNGNWSLTLSNLTAMPGGFYRAVGQ